ncbi:hypothetical protein MSAS_13310 [Mycobacterium saskatchewanense]|nr:hypothetical protein MSAS_13310 [Mycobacterium saskatchewanense]
MKSASLSSAWARAAVRNIAAASVLNAYVKNRSTDLPITVEVSHRADAGDEGRK